MVKELHGRGTQRSYKPAHASPNSCGGSGYGLWLRRLLLHTAVCPRCPGRRERQQRLLHDPADPGSVAAVRHAGRGHGRRDHGDRYVRPQHRQHVGRGARRRAVLRDHGLQGRVRRDRVGGRLGRHDHGRAEGRVRERPQLDAPSGGALRGDAARDRGRCTTPRRRRRVADRADPGWPGRAPHLGVLVTLDNVSVLSNPKCIGTCTDNSADQFSITGIATVESELAPLPGAGSGSSNSAGEGTLTWRQLPRERDRRDRLLRGLRPAPADHDGHLDRWHVVSATGAGERLERHAVHRRHRQRRQRLHRLR